MIENFGGNIARLRKEHNMSQTELAEQIGVQKQTVSNIERGVRYPTFETLEKFATLFHATPMQLFGNAKEVALADTPAMLNRIDKYDKKIQNLYHMTKILDRYSDETLIQLANNIDYIRNFFVPTPRFLNDGEPDITPDGKQAMTKPLFDQLPLDKIDEIVDKINFIKQNQNTLDHDK